MAKLPHLFALTALLGISGCSAPQGPPLPQFAQSVGPACFRANEVYGYTQGSDGYVDLQTASGPFRAKLGPACPNFSWMMQIGVRPVESSWLCAGKPDQLITAFDTPFSRCSISEIRPLMSGPLPG
jgi:hypothetical protein